jgi:hypothetical protein
VRPEKEEINRVRITVGGNLLDYLGKTSTEAASIETTKLLINNKNIYIKFKSFRNAQPVAREPFAPRRSTA